MNSKFGLKYFVLASSADITSATLDITLYFSQKTLSELVPVQTTSLHSSHALFTHHLIHTFSNYKKPLWNKFVESQSYHGITNIIINANIHFISTSNFRHYTKHERYATYWENSSFISHNKGALKLKQNSKTYNKTILNFFL